MRSTDSLRLSRPAEEQHFGRAAPGVQRSQPALSGVQHRKDSGITIVQRGHRSRGSRRTATVSWPGRGGRLQVRRAQARGQPDDRPAVRNAAYRCHTDHVAGHPHDHRGCLRRFDGMRHQVFTLTAAEISRIADFELDIGVSYLNDDRLKDFETVPLFRERYVLVRPDGEPCHGRGGGSRAVAAVHAHQQHAESSGHQSALHLLCRPTSMPRMETDSMVALYAHVRCAGRIRRVFRTACCAFWNAPGTRTVPIVPELHRRIGLVVSRREP